MPISLKHDILIDDYFSAIGRAPFSASRRRCKEHAHATYQLGGQVVPAAANSSRPTLLTFLIIGPLFILLAITGRRRDDAAGFQRAS